LLGFAMSALTQIGFRRTKRSKAGRGGATRSGKESKRGKNSLFWLKADIESAGQKASNLREKMLIISKDVKYNNGPSKG